MEYIITAVIAYFIGNLSPSYLFGKLAKNIDIREHGSGNAGSTNVLRVLGKKMAALTFLVDAFKGIAGILITWAIFGGQVILIAGSFVVIGHNWPIILKFKGGKGVATTIGITLIVHPLYGFLALIIGLATLYISKIVSLGSMVGITTFGLFMILFSREQALFGVILAAMALYRHKENIARLLRGEEKKITGKKGV